MVPLVFGAGNGLSGNPGPREKLCSKFGARGALDEVLISRQGGKLQGTLFGRCHFVFGGRLEGGSSKWSNLLKWVPEKGRLRSFGVRAKVTTLYVQHFRPSIKESRIFV